VGEGGFEKRKKIRVKVVTGIKKCSGACASMPNGRIKSFYHYNLSRCGRRAKRAGCGRVRSRNTCFGHVIIKVRQGLQRREAVAAREDQHGRCALGQSKYYRHFVSCGNLILAAMYLQRVRVACRARKPPITPGSRAMSTARGAHMPPEASS
jgi:hypothetical protein